MALTPGHRLMMARHLRRLSQKEVADFVGISQKHLCQIEQEHVALRNVAGGTIYKLAHLLGLTADALLEEHDEQISQDTQVPQPKKAAAAVALVRS